MNYAHIFEAQVREIIPQFNVDGLPIEERYTAEFVATCVQIPDDVEVSPGDSYVDGEFGPPLVILPEPLSPAEILAANEATKSALLTVATLAIAPLQDAVDLGEETAEEAALLKAWKQYRVALNRVSLSTQVVAWPVLPA